MRTGAVLLCVCTLCLVLVDAFTPIALRLSAAGAWKSPLARRPEWTGIAKTRGLGRMVGLRMAGDDKEGQQQDGPPPIDFAAGFGDGAFLPADFLAMHEMIVAAQMGREEADLEMANVGAAISDEVQRSYLLSVAAFPGTPDYCRALSTKDESAALKYVRSETMKLPQEEAIMQIYPEQGKWMAQLVLAMGAKKVLEVGTFTGYSSTSMASVLPPGGRLICCDVNEDYASTAREAWRKAGVSDMIDLRLGPALATLNELLEAGEAGTFDAIFIDADKENSDEYYEAALRLLRDGGVVMIDDSLWSGRVVDEEQHTDPETVALRELNLKMSEDPRIVSSLLPIADGVTFGVKMPEWATKRGVGWGTAGQGSRASDPAAASWSDLGGRVIAVEGNVAAGKAALIDGLSEVCAGGDVDVQEEEPDAALLAGYYQDPKAMGFAFQIYMLNKCQRALRSAHQKRQSGKICLTGRSVWGNKALASANLRASNISPDQFKMYEGLVSGGPTSADLLVYLDVPPQICASRCKARGRDMEGSFGDGFLGELDTAYYEVVRDAAAGASPPVLVLDWREYGRAEDAASLIAACLKGTVPLPGVSYAKEVPPDAAESDTVIDVDKLNEMNEKRSRGEEFLIADFRAGPRTFLQVLSPMLAGGAAMGLSAGTAEPDIGGRLFVVEPSEGVEGYQELHYVFRRAVLHGLSRLMDVVIVSSAP